MMVDSALLLAYLDGELDVEETRRVEEALAASGVLRTELEAQRRLRDRLAAHYAPALDEPAPPHLRAMLESKVIDLDAARERRSARGWLMPTALAASLVLGLAVGRQLPSGEELGTSGGTLVARGALAQALNTQLASAQPSDAVTQIGVSFSRSDGSLCRTFARASLSGLACREGDDWRMILTATPSAPQRGAYRQAGSEAPLVLQAAQELMAGEPLDAAAERRARDAGWRPSQR